MAVVIDLEDIISKAFGPGFDSHRKFQTKDGVLEISCGFNLYFKRSVAGEMRDVPRVFSQIADQLRSIPCYQNLLSEDQQNDKDEAKRLTEDNGILQDRIVALEAEVLKLTEYKGYVEIAQKMKEKPF